MIMLVDIITLLDSDFMNPVISFHVMLPHFVLFTLFFICFIIATPIFFFLLLLSRGDATMLCYA